MRFSAHDAGYAAVEPRVCMVVVSACE
ncbi:hypothetical protein M3J09_011773 [Ascochyta lentis]